MCAYIHMCIRESPRKEHLAKRPCQFPAKLPRNFAECSERVHKKQRKNPSQENQTASFFARIFNLGASSNVSPLRAFFTLDWQQEFRSLLILKKKFLNWIFINSPCTEFFNYPIFFILRGAKLKTTIQFNSDTIFDEEESNENPNLNSIR